MKPAKEKQLVRTQRYEKPELTGHPSRMEMNGVSQISEFAGHSAWIEMDAAHHFSEMPGR